MPQWWDWKWFLTFCLAAWGAGLSTYQAIQKWRENRAHVRVSLSFSIMMLPAGGPAVPALRIGVENHGFRDVSFDAACVELEFKGTDKRLLIPRPDFCDVSFPHTLSHGRGFTVLMARSDFVAALPQVIPTPPAQFVTRAAVADQLSRKFRSKWQSVELAALLRP